MRRKLLLAIAVLFTIGCDRVSKSVAEAVLAEGPDRSYLSDTVRLSYTENTGGFLSFGAAWHPRVRSVVFVGLTGLALGLLAFQVFRAGWAGWSTIGLTFFIAGGASNLFDRIARGSVIDFMNVGVGPVRTGIFNVADVALMAGAALFICAEMSRARRPLEG